MRYKRKKSTAKIKKARKRAFNLEYDASKWVKGSQQIKIYRDNLLKTASTPSGLDFGTEGMQTCCLDHDHATGVCRGILRSDENLFLGRIELSYRKLFGKTDVELLTLLRGMVKYLEDSEKLEPKLHWGIVEVESRRVSRWKKETIYNKLIAKGLDLEEVDSYTKDMLVELHLNQFIKEKENSLL